MERAEGKPVLENLTRNWVQMSHANLPVERRLDLN
jgi:hypothetical protein